MRYLSSYRYSLLFAASSAVLAFAACGGISDPSKNGGEGTVATVTGALTGADVPAGAHVAVVWRVGNEGTYVVGSDAAVTNGAFTINLATPPDAYFFDPNDDDVYEIGGGANPPPDAPPSIPNDTGDAPPPVAADAGAPPIDTETQTADELPAFRSSRLRPLDAVSGTVSKPMRVAVAGFVVYVDTNGNGKLDLTGTYADSTDEIIGGNEELMLVFLRDGTTLSYEKLRDESGILPTAGYNLVWNEESRWLPLNAVDLELGSKNASLPSTVCHQAGSSSSGSGGGTTDPYVPNEEDTVGPNTDPPPPVPKNLDIECSPDGRTYYTTSCPSAPTPTGLCASTSYYDTACPSEAHSFSGDPPAGWPCPVISAADAGAPPIETHDAGAP